MSKIQLPPTDPTTDLLPPAVVFGMSTSNTAYAVLTESLRGTPPGWRDIKIGQPVADNVLLRIPQNSSSDQALPRAEHTRIDNLGEPGYQVLQPIPVEIKEVAPGEFLASFLEANISIPGIDNDDAYEALEAEILDTFDSLTEAKSLGKSSAEQLRVLKTYIAKR